MHVRKFPAAGLVVALTLAVAACGGGGGGGSGSTGSTGEPAAGGALIK